MMRVNEVEHFDLIPVINEIARHIVIQFRFTVCHDHRFLTLDALYEVWANHSTAFHGARRTEHQYMPVELRIHGETDRLAVQFSEYRSFGLVRRRDLEYLFHILRLHPARRAIRAGFRAGEVPRVVFLAAELIVQLDIQHDAASAKQKKERTL